MTDYTLHCGDVLDVVSGLPDNTYSAVFCDPPYGIKFMGKRWDHGVPSGAVWEQVYRVCKPGAVLMAFGGTRTWHRLAVNIEDAGWQMFDTIMYVYGSGFPKSANISKLIDAAAGAEREVIGQKVYADGKTRAMGKNETMHEGWQRPWREEDPQRGERLTAPATPEAATWNGYGTALKPAYEPILCFRKPLESTYAHSALTYGTAALNVDGCRVGTDELTYKMSSTSDGGVPHKGVNGAIDGRDPAKIAKRIGNNKEKPPKTVQGRWPANLIHSGDPEVMEVFDRAGVTTRPGSTVRNNKAAPYGSDRTWSPSRTPAQQTIGYSDTGSAARYFMCCPLDKASCVLCSLPVSRKHDIMNESQSNDSGDNISCNVNSVRMSLSQNVKAKSIAGDLAPGLLSLEIEGKSGSSPLNASAVASTLMDTQATTPSIVQGSVLILQELPSVLGARFAGNLCDSCATAIAQSLVQMLQGHAQESRQCLDFISEPKRLILYRNLVQCAEILASIDITQITTILKLWSGSVYLAIEDYIKQERAEQTESSSSDQARFRYCSKASSRERNAGLDGMEERIASVGNLEAAGRDGTNPHNYIGGKRERVERGETPTEPRRNHHPTVKPLSLCEYLAKLIVPPEPYRDDAKLLIPYAGSGSEAIGAMQAGWRNITGIELDVEYCEINRRRFDYWAKQAQTVQPALLEVI